MELFLDDKSFMFWIVLQLYRRLRISMKEIHVDTLPNVGFTSSIVVDFWEGKNKLFEVSFEPQCLGGGFLYCSFLAAS